MASNESVYRESRGRTVPIPESFCSVPGYPEKLRIYKIAASQFWQVRCWMAGKTYTRSLRTTSKRNALSLARRFFEQLASRLSAEREPAPRRAVRSFAQLAEQVYLGEAARLRRGEFSRGSLQVLRNRLDLHVLPRFGTVRVDEIGYRDLQAFADALGEAGLTTTTISQYLVIVRKVLRLAKVQGDLQALPEFPRVKVRSVPRGAFSVAEYRALVRVARELRGTIDPDAPVPGHGRFWITHEQLPLPDDLSWVIRFMVNTFVRPGDVKLVRLRHVEIVESPQRVYLRMSLPEVKRHDKPVVSMQAAVRLFRHIAARNAAAGHGGPDDYLFLPQVANREHALAVLNYHFQRVLKACELQQGPLGQKRTLYCLRHTAISFRLLYGQNIDLLTLARNARTSVNMIERFYASALTGEMNVDLLQSRRVPA